jgi:hypothetical protein
MDLPNADSFQKSGSESRVAATSSIMSKQNPKRHYRLLAMIMIGYNGEEWFSTPGLSCTRHTFHDRIMGSP